MTLSKFSLSAVSVVAIALGVACERPACAFDVFWLPAGSSSWNSGANWADTAGGAARGAVPSSLFEEVGVINNGGAATLAAPIADTPGGVTLGQTATDSGTLTISTGGVFTSVTSASTNGVVTVGAAGTGTLNISGTGQLTAPGLAVGGLAASQANFSGSAAVTISGTSTIGRGLRITGPSVNFSSTTGVTLQGNSVLTHEITSATHSPIKSAGAVTLGGTLAVQFNGVTPAVNNSWNLADAAGFNGNFANATVGGNITVTGAPAPAVGSAYRLRNVAGGTNGRLLQVALESMLVLRVNRDTGELTIRNPLGAAVPNLDGYTILSPTVGSLLSSYKGISGAPAGNTGWEKAPGNSATGLAEFKPSGSFDVSSAATSVSLGTGFSKTAVASQGLGISGENLTFSYHATGGNMVAGQVEYIGTPFLNNIVLTVNTTNGQASLKNDTISTLSLDGYSILSSTGALNGASWAGLAGSFANWQKSPTTTAALTETNPVAPTALTAGQSVSLGTIGNFSTLAAQNGLSMKFLIGSESSFRFATIAFTSGSLAGDFDSNGKVDGNDFLVWQRGGSPTPNSAGDLATWRANYGAGASVGAASAVPEPSTLALVACAFAGFAVRGGRRRRVSQPVNTLGGQRGMIRATALLVVALAMVAKAPSAQCAVTITFDPNQPALGIYDQSQVLDDATVPGGTTPGGGTYNSQAYTDNAGPLGQTFTAPATKHVYALTAVSIKAVGDTGGVLGAGDTATTWAIRVSEVNGTALTPLKTVTGIATPQGAGGTEWFTLSITGQDTATLAPNKQYAFEIYTSTGYLGIDATQGDATYAGGTAFNSAGAARAFTNNTLGNLATHGYDRTFVAQLTAPTSGPGDADDSGGVNIADYNLIKSNLEKAVPIFTGGDLDGNSYVDLNDFRRWRVAAGPALAAQVGVPEPGTATLGLAATLLGMGGLRKRRSRRATPSEGQNVCTPIKPGIVDRRSVGMSMSAKVICSVAVVGMMLAASLARATVTMTFGATAPTTGTFDQFNLLDDATVPGGTAPGDGVTMGGTLNSQAFSDNNGPPGQTFTTPASSSAPLPAYKLNSIWLKGGAQGSANFGGFNAATTWGIRISEVNGTILTPVKTVTGIAHATGTILGDEWFTWTFTADDLKTLQPSKLYAFDLFSSAGYLGFDATQGDSNYTGGTAFNSGGGGGRNFNGLTTGNLANHGYDRTFLVSLSPSVLVGPGDVDSDGDTDLADYGLIKTNFFLATGATRAQGDLNGDGRVAFEDYVLWRNAAAPALVASIGVPEPASLSLAAAAAALLVGRARRARRIAKTI